MCCKLEIFVMAPVGTQFQQWPRWQWSAWTLPILMVYRCRLFTKCDEKCELPIFEKVEFMCCWRLIWHSFVCFLFFFFRTRCPSVFSFYPLFATFRDTWEVDISGVGTTGNEEVREIPQVFGHIFVNSYTASIYLFMIYYVSATVLLCPHSI